MERAEAICSTNDLSKDMIFKSVIRVGVRGYSNQAVRVRSSYCL